MRTEIRKKMENLLYKAAIDKDFRNRCLTKGREVLEKELDIKLDIEVVVTFKENDNSDSGVKLDGKHLLFILPDFVGNMNKLKKSDLEMVSGGAMNIESNMAINNSEIDKLINLI